MAPRGGEVGPVSFTIQPGAPLKFLKLEHGNPPSLGPPQSRFRLSMSVAIPSVAQKACVGVLIHAPSSSAFAEQGPDAKEGVAIWMETDGNGHKRYHVGGRDLLSTHVESKSYPTWDATTTEAVDSAGAAPDDPWFVEVWEISMEGQRGLAAVCDGRVKLRFRAGPTGGHVCFFNGGSQAEGLPSHFANVGMREMGTATVPRVAGGGGQSTMGNSTMGQSMQKSQSAPSHPAGNSLLDSQALHQSLRLAKYAQTRPARVFVPALRCLMGEKKKVMRGSRRPKPTPWSISPWYQEFKPYEALQLQKEQANNKTPLKIGKPKRRRRKVVDDDAAEGAGGDAHSDSEDGDPDAPERRLQKHQIKQLQDLFDKFDKYKNGWADITDLPKIFMTFLGYRHQPTELTQQAVKMVTTYTAVEFSDFLKVFCHFCDCEEERMKKLLADEYGEDAQVDIHQMRTVMDKEREPFFPWVIAETVGGYENTVDSDGFVLAFRDLRLHCGFTKDEREELEGVFEKFDQDGSGNISTAEMRRVLQYMGFNPSEEMFASLVKAVDTDGSGEIDVGEFLTAMRIYTEMQSEQFRAVFNKFDMDGSGEIDTQELFGCIKQLGWYPTRASIEEAVQHVDKDGTGEINFDEFFTLMQYLRKTEGFTKKEIQQFKTLFLKFDVDGSGEISTLELGPVLRNLGYPTSMNLQQGLISEVDVDGSGEIDMGELLKLLRKYRNHELQQTERLFREHCKKPDEDELAEEEAAEPFIDSEMLPTVIEELGWEPSEKMLGKACKFMPERIPFDDFVVFVQRYRDLELAEFQNRAGFTEGEVEFYYHTFNRYDRDGGGNLSLKELMPLLQELGKEPKTVIQRDKLTTLLAEVDEDGSGEIDFKEFLQLMRKFLDESDAEQLRKEKDVVGRTNFTADEVTLWRDIFVKFDDDKSGEFDTAEGKKLLQAVGINLNERVMHDRYLQMFKEVDEDENGAMDFPEFLLLMRKLIDMDFGGIATRTQLATDGDKKKKKRGGGGGEPASP